MACRAIIIIIIIIIIIVFEFQESTIRIIRTNESTVEFGESNLSVY
jgi:hypothetical protein